MPFDPNQPRVPAGDPTGGEWTDDPAIIAMRKGAGLPALPNSPDKVIKKGDYVFDGIQRGWVEGEGALGNGIPAWKVDTGQEKLELFIKDQTEKVKFADDELVSISADDRAWLTMNQKDVGKIAKDWGTKYSGDELRAFAQSYLDYQQKTTNSLYKRALNNRYRAAMAAIDYRAFTLNKR